MWRVSLIAGVLAFSIGVPAAAGPDQQEVRKAAGGEWISLNGQVASLTKNGFSLDYGDGRIGVISNDPDWFDGHELRTGDQLTVTGVLDRDFFELKELHASSIYVGRLNTWYYAGPAEEDDGNYPRPAVAQQGDRAWVMLTGRVVQAQSDAFTLDVGSREIEVDMRKLPAEPDLHAGDRVSVSGKLEEADLFEERRMEASSIVRLAPN